MHSKREMMIFKDTTSAEVLSKVEVGLPFIVRKGRNVLSMLTKDADVKETLDQSLAEFKKRLSAANVSRFQSQGVLDFTNANLISCNS